MSLSEEDVLITGVAYSVECAGPLRAFRKPLKVVLCCDGGSLRVSVVCAVVHRTSEGFITDVNSCTTTGAELVQLKPIK